MKTNLLITAALLLLVAACQQNPYAALEELPAEKISMYPAPEMEVVGRAKEVMAKNYPDFGKGFDVSRVLRLCGTLTDAPILVDALRSPSSERGDSGAPNELFIAGGEMAVIRTEEEYRRYTREVHVAIHELYSMDYRSRNETRAPLFTLDEFVSICQQFPDIDFSQHSLLIRLISNAGSSSDGGDACRLWHVGYTRRIYRDDVNSEVIDVLERIKPKTRYITDIGVIKFEWLLVPRIPPDYKVQFDCI